MWEWVWALQTAAGVNRSVLVGARDRHLDYERSGTPEAAFELDLDHDDHYELVELVDAGTPLLRCFRVEPDLTTPGAELAVVRFGGVLSSIDETAGSNTASVTFRGVFDRLDGIVTDALYARDVTPAGDIAVELINLGTVDNPALGITIGNTDYTEPRDVTYESKVVGDAITELADAFDFELIPLANATGQGADLGRFEVYAQQGSPKPKAVFGYGEGTVGNCTDATRKIVRPRNHIIVTGDEGITGEAIDEASVDKHGRWIHPESMSDVIDKSLLDARARELLVPEWQRIVTITPDPNATDPETGEPITTPVPGVDYWLGDTCPATIRKGAFQHDGDVRIDGIGIDIDNEQGRETAHSLRIDTGGDV